MPYPTATAALRAYYSARRGWVRAGRMEPRETDEPRMTGDARMLDVAAVGRVLAGFNEVARALIQWRYDPWFEAESREWRQVQEELPDLGGIAAEREAFASIGGRGLYRAVAQALDDAGVVSREREYWGGFFGRSSSEILAGSTG